MNTSGLLRRIKKLEVKGIPRDNNRVYFKMPSGITRTLPKNRISQIYSDAFYGKVSDETSIVLSAVSDNSGGRMRELLQMVVN